MLVRINYIINTREKYVLGNLKFVYLRKCKFFYQALDLFISLELLM